MMRDWLVVSALSRPLIGNLSWARTTLSLSTRPAGHIPQRDVSKPFRVTIHHVKSFIFNILPDQSKPIFGTNCAF